MVLLTGLPSWFVILMSFVAAIGVTILLRVVIRRMQRDDGDDAVRHAGPLMPTLGALFAFLSAFVIAYEWNSQSQAAALVQHVAAASSRLAWASTAPGFDVTAIQSSLHVELVAMSTDGWDALAKDRTDQAMATEQFRQLEQTVRASAYSSGVATPAATELLAAMDDLAASRRELAAMAERSLPSLLFIALGISGFALIANAVTLTIRSHRRTMFVVGSIVVLVAVDLAILLIFAAPFRGTVVTSPAPLEHVAELLEAGWFRL